ncbi:MAG TPA: SGNH/GDSL hydrolase family protein [Vicinamibacterales bacterium]
MSAARRATNWVFLGDSLTEGVGSQRSTYVSELANRLRAASTARAVHDFRLRNVDPAGFNKFIRVNVAGYLRHDERESLPALWIWNLASEGRTIDSDRQWLPLLENLQPERVFIHRGSLESILRPACFHSGRWPFWVPRSWRGVASMDPRCYFSATPLRRFKQSFVDAAKQRARLGLLKTGTPQPLLGHDAIVSHYDSLLASLRALPAAVTVLGLLPTDERTFPGSAAHFLSLNTRLQSLAEKHGADFLDWRTQFDASLFYRDGFHPNPSGSARLADVLYARLKEQGAA